MTRAIRSFPPVAAAVALSLLSGCAQPATPRAIPPRVALVEPTDPTWQTKYWGLDRINAVSAWQRVSDASPIVVAVVDSGLASHPDIVNVRPGTSQCSAAPATQDDDGHGTKVSGIIAGKQSGSNAVGVAWLATLRPHKFLCPSGFVETAARDALRAAVAGSPAPDIVNASWAQLPYDAGVAADIDGIVAANPNTLVVFAAPPASPAAPPAPPYPPNGNPYSAFTGRGNVIIVAASDDQDRLPRWAGRDAGHVHIAAPGVGIATSDVVPGAPGTTTFQGASASAAFVSGCAALVKRAAQTAQLTLSGAQVRDLLLSNADSKDTLKSGVMNGRRLNCGNAVNAVR
jgi:hypothetical protein